VGGNNYHNIAAGIDSATTPFMRAMHWDTLADAWAMDDNDPPRYVKARPPMYNTDLAGAESGLMAPAVANDVVFCSTSKISVYAFNSKTGEMLWEDQLGSQTGGMNGGYGYCMGPAVSGNYVVAGALVAGLEGGVLRIYSLPTPS
jgi:outer membrane protein assembly factor BamB